MVTCTDKIPLDKFQEFHKILKKTNGRYLSNPYQINDFIWVHYIAGDYKLQHELYNNLFINVKEVNRNQWYRIFFRRIKSLFKS